MSTFSGINGQSLFDVCLNTYGSLDYMYKLIQDSGVANINQEVKTQDQFTWDSALVVDQVVNKATTLSGVIFATAATSTNSTYYIVEGKPGLPASVPYTPPYNPGVVNQYQKVSAVNYEMTADSDTVQLNDLIGKDILQIERNVQPTTDFAYNKTTGTITFTDTLMTGEKLYILVTQMITV
jgi:hypothetical protein